MAESADTSAVTVTEEAVKVPKKRGRKPSKERKGYFYEEQEQAVVDYLATDDKEEKDRIFNEILKPAFTRMVESIIRRYNLYPPDEEFQQTFDDTISFLMTKLSCFDPTANFKAYSYCGTICKNYLIYKINFYAKNKKRNTSYDDPNEMSPIEITDNISYSYDNEDKNMLFNEITSSTVNNIEKILESRNVFGLTQNEIKIGKALITFIEHWEELFVTIGSNKFNRSSIIMYLTETTNLSPKEVRDALKIYKKRYFDVKLQVINK